LVKPDEIAPDFNQKTKPPEAHFPGSTVVTHQTVWVAEMQVSLCDEFVTFVEPASFPFAAKSDWRCAICILDFGGA
jgi:hypothetical protein